MICEKMWDWLGDWLGDLPAEPAFVMLALFMFVVAIIGWAIAQSWILFGGFYLLIMLIVLTEISYHIEPRDDFDKEYGRTYGEVALKKLSSLIDAALLVALDIGVYKLVKAIKLEQVIFVLKKIGFGLLAMLLIGGLVFLYLWLNRLRDMPKKKIKRRSKNGN